jgi:tetratricopeptide (TPR) repeat protein
LRFLIMGACLAADFTLRSALFEAQRLAKEGDFRGALRTLETGMRLSSDPTVLPVALNEAGFLHCRLGEVQEAVTLLQRAVRLSECQHGRGTAQTAVPLINLALAWAEQRKFDKAQKALEQVLEIRMATLEQRDPAVSNTLTNLASVCMRRGRVADAESYARRALRNLEEKPDSYPLALAAACNVLAILVPSWSGL